MFMHRVSLYLFTFLVLISSAYGDFCFEDPCFTSPDCGFAYNPQFYGQCNPCDAIIDRVTFRVDYLYWTTTGDGLELGITESQKNLSSGSRSDRSHVNDLDFNFNSGTRIGLLYLLPCDGWDTSLNWITYSSKASARGHASSGSETNTVFISNWEHFPQYQNTAGQIVFFTPDYAKGRWGLDLNIVDLELGKKFYISPCLIARPFLGLRYASINQSYKVHSYSNVDQGNPDLGNYVASAKSKCDYNGFGLLAGFDLDYKIGCNFSLFGRAAGSILYGSFHRKEKENADMIFPPSQQVLTNTLLPLEYHSNQTFYRSRAITDFSLGLKWEDCFCTGERFYPLQVAIAWEHHGFFRMNQFRFARIQDAFTEFSDKDGDLMTQGLTLSFSMGF
jgi:hypothetical protein